MSTSETYNECIQILNDKKNLNHAMLQEKWKDFINKFPKLYEMLTQSDPDVNLLKFLCDSALKQQNMTKEEALNNEFIVGDKLADKYLYDKFEQPSEQQKQFIKETLRKKIQNGETFSAKKD